MSLPRRPVVGTELRRHTGGQTLLHFSAVLIFSERSLWFSD
jgi:hypothetical protein